MSIERTIALRYLRPRRLTFIGIVGLLSSVGIILGTAALIIVLSLFNGFRDVANELMTSFGPHVRVRPASTFTANGEARGWSPIWTSTIVVQAPSGTSVASGMGITDDDAVSHDLLKKATVVGSPRLLVRENIATAVVSSGLAQTLNLYLGDTLRLISPQQIESSLTMMTIPRGVSVIVIGMFQSNASRETDASTIFVPAQIMSMITGRASPSEWHIRLDDPATAPTVAQQLRAELSRSAVVDTWQDINRGLYDTMKLERLGSFFVLLLIIIVAAFSILVSLTMGVVEKRHDIAMLKSMGLSNAGVARIYVWQGFLIGAASVSMGTLLGVTLCFGQITFQWIRFDMAQGYLIPALPMSVHAIDVVIVAFAALALSSAAAIYPARRAAALELISSHTR